MNTALNTQKTKPKKESKSKLETPNKTKLN